VKVSTEELVLSHLTPDQVALYKEFSGLRLNSIDPEAYMNVEEIIRYHGYPVEVYEVETADGYIITMQRIPGGKNLTSTPGKPKKPVLVQHGVVSSAAVWVTNTPDKNFPYILAEEGYDVWLGNTRGTRYGKKHIHLTPDQEEFWAFSFDEIAKFDLPAMIDKILNVTGFRQINFVGHSMGTTSAFALLSTQPKYNNIIRTVYAMAPVARVTNIRSPIRDLAPFLKSIRWLLEYMGNGEFALNRKLVDFFATTICNSPLRGICENAIFLLCGYDYAQLNSTRLPVYIYHTPDATSLQNIVHFVQMIRANKFQWQDYGPEKNMAHYGQNTPPLYNVTKITTNVTLFWGENDYLSDPADVLWLTSQLKHLAFNYHVPYPKFAHMDFVWGLDAKKLLYNEVLSVMTKLWRD